MMDQGAAGGATTGVQRLFQCNQDKVRVRGGRHLPADDAPGKHVDDEGDVGKALPGRDVGEVRDPQLIGAISPELPVDAIKRAWRLGVHDGGALRLASAHALQALQSHQPFDSTARHADTFPIELKPDLVRTIDLQVGVPNTLNLRRQLCITLSTTRSQGWLPLTCGMKPIRGWGDLQDTADRLDPKLLAVLVDEGLQDLMRRSSSAWAKNALASFKISLALRSSRFSRSRSLMRWASAVETPSR